MKVQYEPLSTLVLHYLESCDCCQQHTQLYVFDWQYKWVFLLVLLE